jgi:hypothetical protein
MSVRFPAFEVPCNEEPVIACLPSSAENPGCSSAVPAAAGCVSISPENGDLIEAACSEKSLHTLEPDLWRTLSEEREKARHGFRNRALSPKTKRCVLFRTFSDSCGDDAYANKVIIPEDQRIQSYDDIYNPNDEEERMVRQRIGSSLKLDAVSSQAEGTSCLHISIKKHLYIDHIQEIKTTVINFSPSFCSSP